jgi:hypothetical protein
MQMGTQNGRRERSCLHAQHHTRWQNSSTTSDFGTVRLRAASVAMQREQTDAAVSKQMLPGQTDLQTPVLEVPMASFAKLMHVRDMQKQAAAQRAEQDELRRLREELKEKNRLRGATLRSQRQQQQQQIVAIREQMQREHRGDVKTWKMRRPLVPRRRSVTKSMPGSLRSMRKSRWPKAAMLSSKHA